MKLIEAYQEQQLKDIQDLYEKAFPASEKKPFSLILEKRKEGVVGFSNRRGGEVPRACHCYFIQGHGIARLFCGCRQ